MAEHLKILTDTSTPKITVINTPHGNTEPGEETCKAIINTHFPAATEVKQTEYDITIRIPTQELETKYTDWITSSKLKKVFKNFKSKKLPGPDGFKPINTLQISTRQVHKLSGTNL